MPALSIKQFSYLLCALLLVLSSALINLSSAQEDGENTNFNSTGFTSRVVAINGTIVECEGGLVADLSQAQISSLSPDRKIRDLEIGLPIQVEGQYLASESSPSRTFFVATNVKALGLRKEIKLSAPIQQIDSSRGSIKVFNHDVFIDSETRVFKQTKKKIREITFSQLVIGEEITIEADQKENGLIARRIIKGLDRINGAQLIGFSRQVNGGILEFNGGFVADVSRLLSPNFPELNPRSDLLVAVGNIANLNDNADPLLCFAFSFSDPKSFPLGLLEQQLQSVDTQTRSIMAFDRVIPVTSDIQIFINGRRAELGDLILGKRTGIGLVLVDGQLMANTIDQF